jgi:DHA1 family bicyclomycin/chloramphenicol resistance-like MFS transporter
LKNQSPRQIEFVALFALLTSLVALSIDAMLPALSAIGGDLGVGDGKNLQLVVSLFILGMVGGELVFGPLSDAIGRKGAILIGLGVYAAGSVLAMKAASLELLLLGRVLQGVGVSGPKIGSRALIRDRFEGDAMARMMSLIFMIFIFVPMLAPALGQGIMALAGWRAIFLLFLAMATLAALWLAWRQEETLPPERRTPLALKRIGGNLTKILRHPQVMAYTVAVGFVFGGHLLYLSTAEAIFVGIYGAGAWFPLWFGCLAFGIGVAFLTNSRLVMRHGAERLSVLALSGLLLFAGLLLGAALASGGVPPFPLMMALSFSIFFSVGILFGNLNALAMVALGRVAGLGASVVASISSLIAVLMAVSIGRFYDDTVVPLASGFIIAGTAALLLVLWARRREAGAV